MILLQILATIFLIFAVLVCAYHLLLAIVALFFPEKNQFDKTDPKHTFAIVIPAHNEETTLPNTLISCRELDYPREKYATYVIADNCDDRTAEIADQHGAICLKRNDPSRRGKGYALQWAFPKVLADGHDALLVLDADCQIDRHALREFDSQLQAGHRILQVNAVVSNPDQNGLTYMLALANVIENCLFYAPKSRLGLAVLLRGTGMVFHRDVLIRFPWRTSSIVEDTEYSYQILTGGEHIRYINSVSVRSDYPIHKAQLAIQRKRWIAGNMRFAKTLCFKLFQQGLIQRRVDLIDASLTIWIISRPLIVLQLLMTTLLVLACFWLVPNRFSFVFVAGTLGIIGVYAIYVITAIVILGVTIRRLGLLLYSPLIIFYYLMIALYSIFISRVTRWHQVTRTQFE